MEIGSVKRIHMNEWKNTGVPFFRARDIVAKFNNKKISDPIYISEETYNSNILKSGKVKKGQLLITGVGTIGIPYLITDDSPLYFKDGNVIWLKNNNYDGNFIFYFFTTNLFKNYLFKITGTGTVGTYTIENAKKTPISTPQINEQIKIGKLFNILENLLALYERKLKLLSQVKKYFLDNLFTEKEYPNLRFKGFTDAWEQRQLRKLAKLITKGTTPQKYDGNINFIKVENIEEVSINPKAKILESEHLGKLKRSILKENDILFSIAGSLGKVGLVNSAILPANTNQALAIIRLSESKDIEYNYIFNYLRSNYIQHFIRRLPSVGAQPNLSLKQINELVIKFPNYCEQQKISNMLDRLNNILTLYENKQQHLTEIKNTLLNTMFI